MLRVFVLAAALLTPATALADVPAGCTKPWDAMAIAKTLQKQHIGGGWKQGQGSTETMSVAGSKPVQAMIVSFGCQGDYLDELQAEDAEAAKGLKFVRFQNDSAFVIVLYARPVTAAESAVTRATLNALTQ